MDPFGSHKIFFSTQIDIEGDRKSSGDPSSEADETIEIKN
jgi:hypothetical protein